MIIKQIRVYQGPNIYSHKLVVRMDVQLGVLVNVPTCDIPGFNEQLLKFFPELIEHKCSLGHTGGFVKRLKEGTYLAHVIEHLCLEIQKILGFDIKFGKARNIQDDLYQIIYEYINPVIGNACGFVAINIINAIIEGRNYSIEQEIDKLRELCARYSLGPSTSAIVNEAKKEVFL